MTSVINYDKPVKNFIDQLAATGHLSPGAYKKTSVTFHHNAGRLTNDDVMRVWTTRRASAHFDVDYNGSVAQYVRVNGYAWAVGNTQGNQSSISIELSNSSSGGNWPVSETTWKGGARLAGWLFAKVIGTRPSKSNVKFHHDWPGAATACAGPYMDSIRDQLLAEVIKAYDYFTSATLPPPPPKPPVARKSNTQIAAEVWAGKWGSGDERARRLKAAGYDAAAIQALVNRGVGKGGVPGKPPVARKSVTEVAREVIAGKYGNGPDRRANLARAGYNATTVQREVNRLLS